MVAGRLFVNVLVLFLALAAGLYQFQLKPLLKRAGKGRIIESVGNNNCKIVPELKACEKIVLHQPTGIIYLACSTPESRVHWMPATARLNATGASRTDYVAKYDSKTGKVTPLKVVNFSSPRGLSLHGMDVVPSSSTPSELWIYLVNHRAPLGGLDASKIGADSAVEIFKTTLGSSTMTYIRTVEDPDAIITPNDVSGSPDGKSFYVTNDHGVKVGLVRDLDNLVRSTTSVVYCDEESGCKFAIEKMHGSNGITQAPNGTVYVVDSIHGSLYVLEKQADYTLFITDVITTDRTLDNVAVDADGQVWIAAFPNLFVLFEHFSNPIIPSPSTVFRFSINTGPNSFYGQKYKVDRVFEDDGAIASGITSAVYDSQRNLLYLSGLVSPQLAICEL